ncbi:DNA polymerase IV [Posidoniimonas corsicana]|uniref:DNA polymerase IV n=1 Tax=Posidoniimonas corsicana TaxID=1938618 RepID=A0A5C5VCE7_9BACT|nr:DNA polymerase Y family protein [Posidoniimonas corsicana]TWT35285.1 DNA polymerase IV [Posidoniimonas corsicana]
MASGQRILAAWLPDWPVQRLMLGQRSDGAPRQAVAVSAVLNRVERVTACCAEARRLGVTPGMRTAEAQAAVGPGKLMISPSDPGEDRLRLEQIAAAAERFSPVVALEDNESPAALLLDVTGMWPLWSGSAPAGEKRLADSVGEWLRQQGLENGIAIAATVGLALGAARFGGGRRPVVDDAESDEVAQRLPITALRLDEETVFKLRGFNLTSVGQLLALPRASLPSRFGPAVNRRLAQLLGQTAEPLTPVRPVVELQAEWRFESSVSNAEAISSVATLLFTRLEGELVASRLGAKHIVVTYLLDAPRGAEQSVGVELRVSRPTCSRRELLELFALRSEGLRFEHAVAEVRARVAESEPLQNRQRRLFEDDQTAAGFERDLLVNRLAARVGQTRVCRVGRRRSHDPLRAYRRLSAIDLPRVDFRLSPDAASQARRTPLLLKQGGRALRVEVDRDGEPRAIWLAEQQPVATVWGPERVETGWWRGEPLARDAYWVALPDGRRLWLLHDLRRDRWRLVGGLD